MLVQEANKKEKEIIIADNQVLTNYLHPQEKNENDWREIDKDQENNADSINNSNGLESIHNHQKNNNTSELFSDFQSYFKDKGFYDGGRTSAQMPADLLSKLKKVAGYENGAMATLMVNILHEWLSKNRKNITNSAKKQMKELDL